MQARSKCVACVSNPAAYVARTPLQAWSSVPVGRKILVFGHHSGVLDALEAHFTAYLEAKDPAASLVMVKGSSSLDKRHEAERRFQSDPNCKLAVLSVGAAGVGPLSPLHRANVTRVSH